MIDYEALLLGFVFGLIFGSWVTEKLLNWKAKRRKPNVS